MKPLIKLRHLLLHKFLSMRVLAKILCIFIPMMLIPLMLLTLVSNAVFSHAMTQRVLASTYSEAQSVQAQISLLTQRMENCAELIVRLVESPSQQPPADATGYGKFLATQIRFGLELVPVVDAAIFVTPEGRAWNITQSSANTCPVDPSLIAQMEATTGESLWLMQNASAQGNISIPVLVMGKRVKSHQTHELAGYLLLQIKESTIASLMESTDTQAQMTYMIDNFGRVISSPKKEMLQQIIAPETYRIALLHQQATYTEFTRDKVKLLSVTVPVTDVQWHLVREIPMNSITAVSAQVSHATLALAVLALILTVIGTRMLAEITVRPLSRLSRAMEQVQKTDLTVRLPSTSTDEIGILTKGFNAMLDRIEALVGEVEDAQNRKRTYELALIHAQIKPHFLYNSLDTIYLLSKLGENEAAQRTTKALADFYRTTLSGGQEIISLEEEVKNVQAYLKIQTTRYEDVFSYSIHLDPTVLGASIPKLTLQPIVENAIYHGLKEAPGKGTLLIEAIYIDGKVRLRVHDNGCGISPLRLAQILPFTDHLDQHSGSFGLGSVDKRLKLYFGKDYGIKISSPINQGTTIEIWLPIEDSNEKGDDATHGRAFKRNHR